MGVDIKTQAQSDYIDVELEEYISVFMVVHPPPVAEEVKFSKGVALYRLVGKYNREHKHFEKPLYITIDTVGERDSYCAGESARDIDFDRWVEEAEEEQDNLNKVFAEV